MPLSVDVLLKEVVGVVVDEMVNADGMFNYK